MKTQLNTLVKLALLCFLCLSGMSCTVTRVRPQGYGQGNYGGFSGGALTKSTHWENTPRDFTVTRVNRDTGERIVLGNHVLPKDLDQHKTTGWQWSEKANYFDSQGRSMPGMSSQVQRQNQGHMSPYP